MTQPQICSLTVLFALSGVVLAAQPDLSTSVDAPQVWVRLEDFSATPWNLIEKSSQEATRVFRDFGIRLEWLLCSGPAFDPGCLQINGPSALNLRLLNRDRLPPGVRDGVFGFAAMSTRGRFATIAYVDVDRVAEISDGRKYRNDVLLGAVMAHEIGHLLLGINGHAKWGIMQCPWGPTELQAADRHTLRFSRKEARRMEQSSIERLAQSTMPSGFVGSKLELSLVRPHGEATFDFETLPRETTSADETRLPPQYR